MKLLVLGSTGGSGTEVIKEALLRNHEVMAIARNPDKVTVQHANLKVCCGSGSKQLFRLFTGVTM